MDKKLEQAQAQLPKTYDDLLDGKTGSIKTALRIYKAIKKDMPVNAKSLMKAIEDAQKCIDKKNW